MDREFRKNGYSLNQISFVDRLRYIGDNAMGSLSFESSKDNEEIKIISLNELEQLNTNAFQIYEEKTDKILDTLNDISSSGGSRPKGNLFFSDDFSKCSGQYNKGFAAWIVKFKTHSKLLSSEEGVCECIYSMLARNAGIRMPQTHLFELRDSRLFAVERFDRREAQRIFSASAAGLLGADWRLPSLDYEQLIKLTSTLTRNQVQTQEIFRRMIFNLFSGNQDDHAKNWNFLQSDDGSWILSPAFDLTFSPNKFLEHSTSFLGFGKKPDKSAILKLSKLAGVEKPKDVICEVVEAVQEFSELAKKFSVKPSAINEISRVLNEIYQQNKDLLKI